MSATPAPPCPLYPQKYAISLAVAEAVGSELSPAESSGGRESNSLLEPLGFEVIQTGDWETRPRPKREYRRPDENPETKPADPFVRDPDETRRGLRAHANIQNALHDFLAAHGIESWSPNPDKPSTTSAGVTATACAWPRSSRCPGAVSRSSFGLGSARFSTTRTS